MLQRRHYKHLLEKQEVSFFLFQKEKGIHKPIKSILKSHSFTKHRKASL